MVGYFLTTFTLYLKDCSMSFASIHNWNWFEHDKDLDLDGVLRLLGFFYSWCFLWFNLFFWFSWLIFLRFSGGCDSHTWNFLRAQEHYSGKICFRFWKDLWNTSELGWILWVFSIMCCTSSKIGTFKATFPLFNPCILWGVAINRLKMQNKLLNHRDH